MSRSRRKTPIATSAKVETDKPFKVSEHRRERRARRLALVQGQEQPDSKAFGDPWYSPKDGKGWWGRGAGLNMRK